MVKFTKKLLLLFTVTNSCTELNRFLLSSSQCLHGQTVRLTDKEKQKHTDRQTNGRHLKQYLLRPAKFDR